MQRGSVSGRRSGWEWSERGETMKPRGGCGRRGARAVMSRKNGRVTYNRSDLTPLVHPPPPLIFCFLLFNSFDQKNRRIENRISERRVMSRAWECCGIKLPLSSVFGTRRCCAISSFEIRTIIGRPRRQHCARESIPMVEMPGRRNDTRTNGEA